MKRAFILLFLFNSVTTHENIVHHTMSQYRLSERFSEKKALEAAPFTIDALRSYMGLVGVKERDIVLRQAIIETGNFTSMIFRENNNLFGMKLPAVRPTTALGSKHGHAFYKHWTDSVKDYKLWQDFYKERIENYDSYIEFLSSIPYAMDVNYNKKLRS